LARYRTKSEFDLAYAEGKKNILNVINQLKDRTLNELYAEFTRQFEEKEADNVVLRLSPNDEAVKKLLLKTTKRALGDDSDV